MNLYKLHGKAEFFITEMKNKDLIKNYYDQLAELQKQYWFEGMETKEYCVRYDAINKRIQELENE